jgi:hypothetical protein
MSATPMIKRLSETLKMREEDLCKLFRQDTKTVQKILAPKLRKDLSHYVQQGNGVVAKAIRGDNGLRAKDDNTLPPLLTEQAQDKIWTHEVFAAAAGERYGMHVAVIPQETTTTGVKTKEPFALYRSFEGAPIMALKNSDNNHFGDEETINDDGNCFYNALAQNLQKLVTPELDRLDEVSSPNPDFNAIQMQKKIEACILKKTTPEDLKKEQDRETQRMQVLEKEKPHLFRQIQQDYLFALELARGSDQMVATQKQTAQEEEKAVDFCMH